MLEEDAKDPVEPDEMLSSVMRRKGGVACWLNRSFCTALEARACISGNAVQSSMDGAGRLMKWAVL
jgi:hypothetical protein